MLGENPQMTKVGRPDLEEDAPDVHGPRYRKRTPKCPPIPLLAGKHSVCLAPLLLRKRGPPDSLSAWTLDHMGAEAFQLPPAPGIKQSVITRFQ